MAEPQNSTGGIAGKNVYGKGIDEIVMRTDYVKNPSGLTYYYQEDHEGSVTHLTNASGGVIESYRYDAFGAPTITTANGVITNNRFMFTGREYNQQFGIYEYRARTYHPGLGRFLSEDPKGFDAGDYNLFRYCKNDPEDHTDPMGLSSECGVEYNLQWHIDSHIPERVRVPAQGEIMIVTGSSKSDQTPGKTTREASTDKSGARTPSAEAIMHGNWAVAEARKDYAKEQKYYGYVVYEENGQVYHRRSEPGKWVDGAWRETYTYPKDARVIVIGHLHPPQSTSFSPADHDASGGAQAPIMKNSARGIHYTDVWYNGWRSLLHDNHIQGEPWRE